MALLEKSEIGQLEQAKDWLEGIDSEFVVEVLADHYGEVGMCAESAKQAWLLIGVREGWINS